MFKTLTPLIKFINSTIIEKIQKENKLNSPI